MIGIMPSKDSQRTAALVERLGRLIGTEGHAGGLLPVHWEALRYLQRANRFSQTSGALVAYLGLTKGTVSQTVKALESKGLLNKRGDPKDRRRVRLTLTPKATRFLKDDPLGLTVAAVADLSEPTRQHLSAGLETLLTARLAAQGRLPFGMCRDCTYYARHHKDGDPHYCLLLNEKLAEADSQAICYEQLPKRR